MVRYSIEHTSRSGSLSLIALILFVLAFLSSNAVLGIGALVFMIWSLTFIRVTVETGG